MKRAACSVFTSDGTEIKSWEQVEITDSFTDPLGRYAFKLRPTRREWPDVRERLRKGERLSLRINGHPQAELIIVATSAEFGDNGIQLSVDAKNILATAYEASVDPETSKRFTTATAAADVVLEVFRPFGFTEVASNAGANVNVLSGKAVDKRGADVLVEDLKLKDLDAQDGETRYGIVSRILGRLGVALRLRHDGVLLICRPDYEQAPCATLVEGVARPDANHILAPFTIAESNDGCPSSVVVRGGSSGEKGKASSGRPMVRAVLDAANEPSGVPYADVQTVTVPRTLASYVSSAHPFKPLYVYDKVSTDAKAATHRARLIHGRRAAEGWVAECEVEGWTSATGRIWTVDTVVHFASALANFEGDLWLSELTRSVSRGGGERTRLKLLPLGALVLGDVPG